jgi:hypothetical protein
MLIEMLFIKKPILINSPCYYAILIMVRTRSNQGWLMPLPQYSMLAPALALCELYFILRSLKNINETLTGCIVVGGEINHQQTGKGNLEGLGNSK